jgi:hypothetical protein
MTDTYVAALNFHGYGESVITLAMIQDSEIFSISAMTHTGEKLEI